jgi:ketosteroid isomerase-like protein
MVLRAAGIAAGAAALAVALGTGGCSLWPFGSGSADAGPREPARPRTGLAAEADRLLEADRVLAARVLEDGAPAAFHAAFDAQGVRLSARGEPAVGPDAVRGSLAAEHDRVLSWEPQHAEVFAPGDWGWTWGEWQAHEPGAGGRRVAQGRYLNVWKKQKDGTWKIRADLKAAGAAP